jgi:hypothetical protein
MYPPGRIKKAPDFAAMMANGSRHLLGIAYKGILWRWKECATCGIFFWKNCTSRDYMDRLNSRVYCSKPCQLEGYRVLNNARQLRWQARRRAGLIP